MNIKKSFLVLAVGLCSFSGFVGVALSAEPEVLFEITSATNPSSFWGRGSGTAVNRVAQSYTPQFNHSVCAVDHMLARFGPVTDRAVLSLYDGNLEGRTFFVASTSIDGSGLTTGLAYTPFLFNECVSLLEGREYYFVFSRTVDSPGSGYISGFRASSQYSYSRGFQFNEFSPFGWQSISKDWSLRLRGFQSKEPVIVIPGILGTKLNRVRDGEEVWPSIEKTIFSKDDVHLNDLLFDIEPLQESGILDSVGGMSFYRELIGKLEENYVLNTDLFLFSYDWRRDLASLASSLDVLVESVASASPTGRVSIVTHSMGGLLIQEYLRATGNADLLTKIIFIGTPHLGAPKAFKALSYGDDFGFPLGSLSAPRMNFIAQNMPAVYQLLPSEEYVQINGGYVADFRNGANSIYDFLQTTSLMAVMGRNNSLLQGAQIFHDRFRAVEPPQEKFYFIAGCNTPTIGTFHLYDGGKVDVGFINGDGTVPLASAVHGAGASQTYYVSEVDHRNLLINTEVLGAITKILLDQSVVFSETISDRSSLCSDDVFSRKTIVASTHSPVELHFYDTLGNHTGILESGVVETGIAGSEHFSLGENHFILLPGGVSYTSVIRATDTGSFDFKIKEYDGLNLVSGTNYLNLPIVLSALVATAPVGPSGETPTLFFDINGDGDFEEEFSPTSLFAGSEASEDRQPPQISFVFSPELPTRADALSLLVTVNDENSGVSLVEVLFGERVIEASSTIDLFFENLGETNLSIRAYDGAGNIRLATTSIFVSATVDTILLDLQRAYELGWISKKAVFTELLQKLKTAIKVEKRIVFFEEKDSNKKKIIKRIEKLEKRFDKLLMKKFTEILTKQHEKGIITDDAFRILSEDVEFILNNQN